MVVGWFVVMNIIQPRVMANSVGIHPVMVLVSVLIGLKLQGVVGAIFAVPVAAVISAFFFFYLEPVAIGRPAGCHQPGCATHRGTRGSRGARARRAPRSSCPGSPADAASLSVTGGAAAVAPTTRTRRPDRNGEPVRAPWRVGAGEPVKPTDDSPA